MTDADQKNLEQLLPFHVNGSLPAQERAEVEKALAADARLRSEAEYLRLLRQQIRGTAPASAGELPLRWVQREIARKHKSLAPRWWRPALAAAALVILIQGGLLMHTTTTTQRYEPLSATGAAQISVRFVPGATADAIQQLLEDIDAQITGGPVGPGFYQLRLNEKQAREQDIDALLQKLKSKPNIVSHAQRR